MLGDFRTRIATKVWRRYFEFWAKFKIAGWAISIGENNGMGPPGGALAHAPSYRERRGVGARKIGHAESSRKAPSLILGGGSETAPYAKIARRLARSRTVARDSS